MTLRLARWARTLAAWLLARAEGWDPVPPPVPRDEILLTVQKDALYRRAVALVCAVELADHTAAGENKQHQVRARLYKEFGGSHQTISLAIEAAVSELGP